MFLLSLREGLFLIMKNYFHILKTLGPQLQKNHFLISHITTGISFNFSYWMCDMVKHLNVHRCTVYWVKRIHTSRFDYPYNTNFHLSTVLIKLSKRTQLRDCLKTKQHSLTHMNMFFCVDITLRPARTRWNYQHAMVIWI